MLRLFPVSPCPGEMVFRTMCALRDVRGVFDAQIQAGDVVYARRSPHAPAHSIWLETHDGDLLAIVSTEQLEKWFAQSNAPLIKE